MTTQKRPLQPPKYWRAEIIITDQPAVGDNYADADFVQEKLVEVVENELYLGFDFKIGTPKQVIPKYDASGNSVPVSKPVVSPVVKKESITTTVLRPITHEKALSIARALNTKIQSKRGQPFPKNATGVSEFASVIYEEANK